MKTPMSLVLALVTAPDMKTARRLARAALKAHLVACANFVPGLESHYWWKGKIEHGKEVLMLFKTSRRQLRALEELIVEEHPYDTPEFVVTSIDGANERYLNWWKKALDRRG
jgi:periplasmic divalent cation tolerance protein